MRAAARAVKWGVFCIPGIATLDDVARSADYGMGFIRIAVSVDHVDAAEPFVRAANAASMDVATNFMKSYTRNVRKNLHATTLFAETAKLAASFGTGRGKKTSPPSQPARIVEASVPPKDGQTLRECLSLIVAD
jgi:hypothetical protein